ncbi:hypothetical protein [[Phormidium ambiguum] IAM M-71]|uniref:hypothetical protein n=1 Tax=[Phormidium ambiguum] IAM M-71 TaxID=454136 RepID=UPI00116126EF|nr:hypothetical protein [Phormidium ambiguum]
MTWREKSVISGDSGKLYLIMQGSFYRPKSQPLVDFGSRSVRVAHIDQYLPYLPIKVEETSYLCRSLKPVQN